MLQEDGRRLGEVLVGAGGLRLRLGRLLFGHWAGPIERGLHGVGALHAELQEGHEARGGQLGGVRVEGTPPPEATGELEASGLVHLKSEDAKQVTLTQHKLDKRRFSGNSCLGSQWMWLCRSRWPASALPP